MPAVTAVMVANAQLVVFVAVASVVGTVVGTVVVIVTDFELVFAFDVAVIEQCVAVHAMESLLS